MNTRAWQDIGPTSPATASMSAHPPLPPPAPPSPRSLAPREHGAYGQLGVPLVASLALAPPNLAALGLAIGAIATFLAHEPLLVLLGQRGSKARTQDGPRAAKRLRFLGTLALVAGGLGLFCAPMIARLGAIPPMLLGIVVAWFVWRKEEKTTIGEVVAAAALSGAGFPIALAEGVDVFRAALVWFVWTIAFGVATVSVRAVIARAKDTGPEPVVLAYVVAIGTLFSTVGLALVDQLPMGVPIALAPFELLGLGVLLADVHTRQLRRVGWGLVGASVLTGAFVVTMLR
ncbi:MAG TPA: YwiC-like family protein [Polyangium sp.]|nr:YwiC-like family protein [Polyangium sp.]